jgi:hypothetical protein
VGDGLLKDPGAGHSVANHDQRLSALANDSDSSMLCCQGKAAQRQAKLSGLSGRQDGLTTPLMGVVVG